LYIADPPVRTIIRQIAQSAGSFARWRIASNDAFIGNGSVRCLLQTENWTMLHRRADGNP
ncbi:hypothetical protein, partial [Mesorhizobium sp. M4B.F.Ca.ET.013.02.1.1]|uniref:hypothetical protein n=1 Tax=Mesorhizobium sp. M4B.F.Ca.ET.013.02.1.1 TaxID=2496755 RepID=UPI001AECD36A